MEANLTTTDGGQHLTPADSADAADAPVRPPHHLAGIEGLRAMAAVAVFFTHWAALNVPLNTDSTFGIWFSQLNIGVSVFFVLSGFLLYRPYARAHRDGASGPAVGPYLVRRFFRIFPAYWVALGFDLLWGRVAWMETGAGQATHLTLTQTHIATDDFFAGMAQAWTLSVELGFYLLLPIFGAAVGRVVRRRPQRGDAGSTPVRPAVEWAAIGLFAAVGIGALVWRNYGTDWLIGSGSVRFRMLAMPEWFAMFAAGMALAVLRIRFEERPGDSAVRSEAEGSDAPGWWRAVGDHPAMCWLAALGLFTLLNQGLGLTLGSIEPWQWVARHLLHIAISLLLLAPIVGHGERPSRLRRALEHPRVQAIGVASYGIYLWHIAILEVLARGFDGIRTGVTDETVIVGLLGLWLSIVAGTLSYRLIEEPARRLAQRVGSRWAPTR